LWVICGLAAFVAHWLRRRGNYESWLEVSVHFVAAALLGVIALIGVLTNDDSET
jgi:hypothetical protein